MVESVSQNLRWIERPFSIWMRVGFTLPALLLAFGGLFALIQSEIPPHVPVGLLVIGAVSGLMLADSYGRIFGFVTAFFVWIAVLPILIRTAGLALPAWLILLLGLVSIILLAAFATRYCIATGRIRYDERLAKGGKPILEREWVYTDAEFVLQHRLAQKTAGFQMFRIFVSLYCLFALAWPAYVILQFNISGWWLVVPAARAMLVLLTVIGVWCGWRATYRLFMWLLICDVPVSLPLMIY